MSTLMRNNSGFGWDPIGKTFTAHEDVWKDYLKLTSQLHDLIIATWIQNCWSWKS
ncbi:hypothetical protein JHK82_019170 [Glycine max]|nr:hypothetical protein JHK82_019170 [Glycine max]